MLDRQSAEIFVQVLGSGVRAARRAVDQNVIPRLISIGLGLVRRIPLVVGLARIVGVDDDTSIAEAAMTHEGTRLKARRLGTSGVLPG